MYFHDVSVAWLDLSEGADLWESGIVKREQYIKVLIDVWQAAY